MYMDLKLNQDKRISFNTTTPKMLGPPPKFNFLLRSPPRPNYFRLKFLGPPLKLKGGVGGGGRLPCVTRNYLSNIYIYLETHNKARRYCWKYSSIGKHNAVFRSLQHYRIWSTPRNRGDSRVDIRIYLLIRIMITKSFKFEFKFS